jgi:hypothetical protein
MAEKRPSAADTRRLAQVRERLFTSVIGDAMDMKGLRQQFLPPPIRALAPDSAYDLLTQHNTRRASDC